MIQKILNPVILLMCMAFSPAHAASAQDRSIYRPAKELFERSPVGYQLFAKMKADWPQVDDSSEVRLLMNQGFYRSVVSPRLRARVRAFLAGQGIPMNLRSPEIVRFENRTDDPQFDRLSALPTGGHVPERVIRQLEKDNDIYFVIDFIRHKNAGQSFVGLDEASVETLSRLVHQHVAKKIDLDAVRLSYETRGELNAAGLEGIVLESDLRRSSISVKALVEIGLLQLLTEAAEGDAMKASCEKLLKQMASGKI